MSGGPNLSPAGEWACIFVAITLTVGGYLIGRALGWWV